MSIAYAIAQSAQYADNAAKREKWLQVVRGMQSGLLQVGSRAPIAAVPAWATPDVAPGGFVTGALRAGGDLTDFERARANEAQELGFRISDDRANDPAAAEGVPDADPARLLANRFLVEHERGLLTLLEMLHSRCYRVNVPEEGCLLVYAWLYEHNHVDEAQSLLREILPFASRLRFHPAPCTEPGDATQVSFQTVEAVKTALQRRAVRHASVPTEQLALHALEPRLEHWYTLREQLLSLWAETLANPSVPPTGHWSSPDASTGRRVFVYDNDGGWPCQQYPDDWVFRAHAVVEAFKHSDGLARSIKSRSQYARMVASAETVLARGPKALSGKDVAWIRLSLASANAKRGLPGSSANAAWLEAVKVHRRRWIQALEANRALYALAVERLKAVAQTDAPYLSASAAQTLCEELTTAFPRHPRSTKSIRRAVTKAVGMDLDDVFTRSKSLEVVAAFLPTFSSTIRSRVALGTNADPPLQYLYEQLLVAFAARRSLLLLDYAAQVRVTELPWLRAIHAVASVEATGSAATDATKAFAHSVVVRALRHFGDVPLCNPFVRELQALLDAAHVDSCALVEELAADIFMGAFTPKFTRAAQVAQAFVAGTVYQLYFGLDPLALGSLLDPTAFAALCRTRAGVATDGYWGVSTNGKVIEQSQILTTHNLAPLFVAFRLHESLEELDVPTILSRCFAEIARLTALLVRPRAVHDWRIRGPLRRSIGHVWRQMVFFFAVLEKFDVQALATAIERLASAATKIESDEYRAHLTAFGALLRSRVRNRPSSVPFESTAYVRAWN